MKRLLYVVYEIANFDLGLTLAREGRRSGAFDQVIWCPYFLPDTESFKQRARDAEAVYIHETTAHGSLADIWSPLSGWYSGRPTRLPVTPAQPIRSPVAAASTLAALEPVWRRTGRLSREDVLRAADADERRVRFCENLLVELNADAIVLPEDNVERDSYAWIAAASRRGIRSVIITYGALAANAAETAYQASPTHQVDAEVAAILKVYVPHWLREGEFYQITRLPIVQALARELAGFAPVNPWLVNTGAADLIALESVAVRDVYLNHGFDPERLAVVGHPMMDMLARAAAERSERRIALAQSHGIQPNGPLVLVAMPPDQFAHRPAAEFATFDDLAEAFARLPNKLTGAAVAVTPHPTITAEKRERIRANGVALVEQSAVELIPLADLFVASASSTIKYALASGVPVIDYDCYRYRYTDYFGIPGVVTASDLEAFRSELVAWQQPARRDRLSSAAQAGRSRWGILDGCSLDRVICTVFGD